MESPSSTVPFTRRGPTDKGTEWGERKGAPETYSDSTDNQWNRRCVHTRTPAVRDLVRHSHYRPRPDATQVGAPPYTTHTP